MTSPPKKVGSKVFSNLNDCWSMDFVSDALFDGRKIHYLTIVDNYSRKCIANEVGQGLKGIDVVSVLEGLRQKRGLLWPSTYWESGQLK